MRDDESLSALHNVLDRRRPRSGAHAGVTDVVTFLRFGRAAPRSFEIVWFDATSCHPSIDLGRRANGLVEGEHWDRFAEPLDQHPILRTCAGRWRDGLSREGSGAYDLVIERIRLAGGPIDHYSDVDDVRRRYEALDVVFHQVEREGRLRTRKDVDPRTFREQGGIDLHVGRGGTVIFGGHGCHRLAMAKVLGLRSSPAQVGVVHRNASSDWRRRFRAGDHQRLETN
jgi:hypothetical protein